MFLSQTMNPQFIGLDVLKVSLEILRMKIMIQTEG